MRQVNFTHSCEMYFIDLFNENGECMGLEFGCLYLPTFVKTLKADKNILKDENQADEALKPVSKK
jgi:hypothetical protein